MALWPYYLAVLGCLIGAGMGLYGMMDPKWAARLVRLQPDPDRPGGFAEFRGTYGGLFFAAHGAALFYLALFLMEREEWLGLPTHWIALGACLACSKMWGGTAIGRIVSIAVDKTGGGFNYASVVFEFALAFLIGAPVIAIVLAGS